jgi:hypothetical protein
MRLTVTPVPATLGRPDRISGVETINAPMSEAIAMFTLCSAHYLRRTA